MRGLKKVLVLLLLASIPVADVHAESPFAGDDPAQPPEQGEPDPAASDAPPVTPDTEATHDTLATPSGEESGPPARIELREVAIHASRGEAFVTAGNLVSAITEFRRALRLEADAVQPRLSLASALYRIGDIDGAIEAYRTALRLQPEAASTHLHLATAFMVKQQWMDARAELQAALRLEPDLLQAHDGLGTVRYMLGDRPGAIASFQQALRLNPNDAGAHYSLGLLLTLANEDAEAAQEFSAAAEAGVPKAQYFLGNAYASGQGLERDLRAAITWWSRAADQEVDEAKEALAHMRQLSQKPGSDEAIAVLHAFADVRAALRREFPDLEIPPGEYSVGERLLHEGRTQEAVPLLIREASVLSEPAEALLEILYEHGVEGRLAPFDLRILKHFQTAAGEGRPRPRLALARIYAYGLGAPRDVKKSMGLLKGHPEEAAKMLLSELSAAQYESGRGGNTNSASHSTP